MVEGITLENFITQTIEQALTRHQLKISAPAREYLTGMLCRFAEQFPLYQDTWLEPITFQYQHLAAQTQKLERRQLSRELGDHCLFLVGYFYDFVAQHGLGQVRYHADVGSSAYVQTGQFPLVEMGKNFKELYLVIGDLHLPNLNDEKVVEVYQKWLQRGDRYYESLLIGKGVIPQKIKARNN